MSELQDVTNVKRDQLVSFLGRVAPEDRDYFKEDITDPATVDFWLSDESDRRWVMVSGGIIVGYLAILPGASWSSHVGEIRMIVDPAQRRQGLGRTLSQRGLAKALERGLRKVVVELVDEQSGAIEMFQRIGFEIEAVLLDHVSDRHGDLHDLLILTHQVDDTSSSLLSLGVDRAVG